MASRPFTRSVRTKRGGSRFRRSTRRAGGRSRFGRRNGRVLTAYNANNSANNFRSKKISRRRWNNMLWNNTLQKPHFRSLQASATSITTPVGLGALVNATFGIESMLKLAGVNPFWTVAGGAIPIDETTAVPLFSQSSIVLRGGLTTIAFTNTSQVDTVRIRVWALMAKERVEGGVLPAVGAAVTREWDPSLVPDFSQSFRVMYSKEVMLLPGSRPLEIKHRHRLQKIDFDTFVNEDGLQPFFAYTAANMSTIDAAAEVAQVIISNNLSFAGDAST